MDVDATLAKLVGRIGHLPELSITRKFGHASLWAADQRFAYVLVNHHDNGMVCLLVKIDAQERDELIESDPDRYMRPERIGRASWLSIRLDLPPIPWELLDTHLVESYRRCAPKRLIEQLDESEKEEDEV